MTFPIPEHPSWYKWDSTKINRFDECPRAVFYEYFLGWRPEAISNHLVFGDCWHKGIAHLLTHGYGERSVLEAQEIFETEYRKEFDASTDELFYPKDVFNAQRALALYAMEFSSDLDRYEVLFTEVSFTAPISETRSLYGRIDAILRDREEDVYFVQEHKTKGGDFNTIWGSEWDLAFQVGTYTHALYCMYPIDKVKGVQVNGAAFIRDAKTAGKAKFMRIPCWRSLGQMQQWLWLANDRMDRVEFEIERLKGCTPSDPLLYAFPLNDRNCTKYFKLCDFHDYCLAWNNPLRHCEVPPLGFKTEFWDPELKPAKHEMKLEWQNPK